MAKRTTTFPSREELSVLADNLPIPALDLPEFSKRGYEPESIRQERTYARMQAGMQSITRFLVERGTVELLTSEQVKALFTELHWCGYSIRKLAAKTYKSEADCRAALIDARRLVSRMEAAEEELFIANRRLVVNCVKPYFWIGQVWIADFLQEGSKALSNAVRKFDFTRGTPFYSYAQKSIQNRLRNFFRDHVRSGSFGIRPNRDMMMLKNIMDTWVRDYGEEASDEILAKITEIPMERVAKLRGYIKQWEKLPQPPVSLDILVHEDGSSLHELIEDEGADQAFNQTEHAEIWEAMKHLPERSRYIMKLRYVEGRTLEETGLLLNLTRARIKQIQDASLKKLRSVLGSRSSF
ncbi:MAG TPA: sigma-70 family RNA polymerase sigma factor [Kiritimatiellia bacterium]|nr:sigma-70 family RNA polymerase sigma factor [Kiritimatiellia bacterium]